MAGGWCVVGLMVIAASPSAAPVAPVPSPPPAVPVTEADFGIRGRARLGLEWDSNARRALPDNIPEDSGGASIGVVGDGALRAEAVLEGGWRPAALTMRYRVGARQFARERDEDLLVQQGTLGLGLWRGERLSVSASSGFRMSRMRSGRRDYELANVGVFSGLRLGRALEIGPSVDLVRFGFPPEPRVNYWGLRPGLRAVMAPAGAWQGEVSVFRAEHWYDGNGIVLAVPIEGGAPIETYCDDPGAVQDAGYVCEGRRRRDGEWQAAFTLAYLAGPLLRFNYLYRRNRSTIDLEAIDRHRVGLSASFSLPLLLALSLRATLQINRGVSASERAFFAEDDENQSSLQVQLRRPVGNMWALALRYGLYVYRFSTVQASFRRQTFYLGVRCGFDGPL